MSTVRTQNALAALIQSRSREVKTIRAIVGDGCNHVEVEDEPNFIWIRPQNRSHPVRAYCQSGANMYYDTVVIAEVHHVGAATYYFIRSTDPEVYARYGTPSSVPSIGAHASQHMYSAGGGDIVYVHPWQITSLRVSSTNPASMSVYVWPCEWWYGGSLHMWPGGETADLSSYLPGTGLLRYVVIYIDASFGVLGYVAGPEKPADNPFAETSPYAGDITTPPGAVVAGVVELRSDTEQIEMTKIWPLRTFTTPDTNDLARQALFLCAAEDALYKSSAGLYTWAQLGVGSDYLEEGICHIIVVDTMTWLVFREQATATTDDPLVYKTVDAGLSWAKAQDFMVYTQGSDLWKVYAVWRNPDDPKQIAVVISKVDASATPQVFYSLDAGEVWVEIENTGLPTFTCDVDAYPRSIAVQFFDPDPRVCVALGEEGLFYKDSTSNWVEKSTGDSSILAVREDKLADSNWAALTSTCVRFTEDNWSNNDDYELGADWPSPYATNILQNMVDKLMWTASGTADLYNAWSRSSFQLSSTPVGEPGKLLNAIAGAPSLVLITDIDGRLYLSVDGCIASLMSLGKESIVAADGVAPTPPVAASTGGGDGEGPTEMEICKAWLLGC